MSYIQANSIMITASEKPAMSVPYLMSDNAASGDSTGDLPNLDFLRATAVALVFMSHLFATMTLRGFGGLGHLGVLFFFVHTSLVLMLSMGRMGLSGRQMYLAFLARRIFRIYPLSCVAISFVVAFHVPFISWLRDYSWCGWAELASNLTLTQNIFQSGSVICVLWSLPFELQMYTLLPLLYMWMRRSPSFMTALFMWLAAVAIAGLEYIARGPGLGSEFGLAHYFPCFIAGVIAWRLMERNRGSLPGTLWIFVLLVLMVLYRFADAVRSYGPHLEGILHESLRTDHGFWWPPYFDLLNDWAFCALTGLALPFFAGIKSVWLNAATKSIAQYSYGIYLSHVPVLWFCFKKLDTGSIALGAVLSVLLTGIVSVVLYYLIEEPAIRLGKVFANQLNRRTSLA